MPWVTACRECDFECDFRNAGGPLTVSLATAIQVITATAVLHNNYEEWGLLVNIQQGDDDQDDEGTFPVDVQDHTGMEINKYYQRQVLGRPNKCKFNFRVLNREKT